MKPPKRSVFPLIGLSVILFSMAEVQADSRQLEAEVRKQTAAIESKLIAWRHDIHQHPELGDQEIRTSALVAEHLRKLGLEVHTGIARTGVVGILKGGKPGGVVALRADMDALPVKEPEGLPFASKAKQQYLGREVDVMHACGHDAHTAMLMAAAEVLAGIKEELPGTVMFIFQPAEEGPSLFAPAEDKSWGATLMMEEGIFKKLKPDAIFGMHVMPGPSGEISYRAGATLAGSDTLEITVKGESGHGGMPWNTVDPIATSALAIAGLQTVVSRRVDLTASPAVVTIGTIHGGSRANIVAESVEMTGTIRVFDEDVRTQIHHDIPLTVAKIAESTGAKATVKIIKNYDPTINNEELTARMLPALKRASDGRLTKAKLGGASEDFSSLPRLSPAFMSFLVSPRSTRTRRKRLPITTPDSLSTTAHSSSARGRWQPLPSISSPGRQKSREGQKIGAECRLRG